MDVVIEFLIHAVQPFILHITGIQKNSGPAVSKPTSTFVADRAVKKKIPCICK